MDASLSKSWLVQEGDPMVNVNRVFRTVPDGEAWVPSTPRSLYQNVMWPMGSTPDRPTAHASSIILGPLKDGVQTLYSTFHWGPGEAMTGTGHGLIRITYHVKEVVEWFAARRRYPDDPEEFDPYMSNENPLFTYSGPHLIAQDPGRCHGNSSPFWDRETGRFHLWYTTFVPKDVRTRPDEGGSDRRIYYKHSDDPVPWADLGKWSEPVEWSDTVGLWARAPPVVINDGGRTAWIIAHNDETTWLPEHNNNWSVRFAISRDKGKTWAFSKRYGIASVDDPAARGRHRGGIIQPSVVQLSDGSLYCACRSLRGYIVEMRSLPSERLGLDWTPPRDTVLPNNNSGICITRLSGTGVKNHLLLIYNPSQRARYPVSIAGSRDGGRTWRCLFDLREEQGELSYPWMVQTKDGLVHCCYSLHRQSIAHDVFPAPGT